MERFLVWPVTAGEYPPDRPDYTNVKYCCRHRSVWMGYKHDFASTYIEVAPSCIWCNATMFRHRNDVACECLKV